MNNKELKIRLFSQGIKVTQKTFDFLIKNKYKLPKSVRSGASSGLDFYISEKYPVNIQVDDNSNFELKIKDSAIHLYYNGVELQEVKLFKEPEFYKQTSSTGTPYENIAQICFDRLNIGIYNACIFDCKFCSIHKNFNEDKVVKTLDEIMECVNVAMRDESVDIRHFMIGGGTDNTEFRSAKKIADLTNRLRQEGYKQSVYAMLAPPSDTAHIDLLVESGVNEIGLNLELWSKEAREKYMIAKNNTIPREHAMSMLEYTVKKIGKINTRTIFVVGLESEEKLLEGIEDVAKIGVMPILSPFRPAIGSELEQMSYPDYKSLESIYTKAKKICQKYNIPLGPTCIPCQNNILAFSEDFDEYRFY